MPFHDKDWEDFQRDCDFFPAYTDYIFGIDTRVQVAQEPGLHPQIYPTPVPAGYETAAAMPSRAQCYAASTPDMNWNYQPSAPFVKQYSTLNATQRIELGLSSSPPSPVFLLNEGLGQQADISAPTVSVSNNWSATSDGSPSRPTMLQLSIPSQSRLTPTTAPPPVWNLQQPQTFPVAASSSISQLGFIPNSTTSRFLRPNEVLDVLQFGFISPDLRRDINEAVTQDWNTINHSLSSNAKAVSITRLKEMSIQVFNKQRETFYRQRQQQQQQQHLASQSQGQHPSSTQSFNGLPRIQPFNTSAMQAHVYKHIPQLRQALSLVLSGEPLMTPEALAEQQRAQQWLAQFKATIPPGGQPFVQHIVGQLSVEIRQRRDSSNPKAMNGPTKPPGENGVSTELRAWHEG